MVSLLAASLLTTTLVAASTLGVDVEGPGTPATTLLAKCPPVARFHVTDAGGGGSLSTGDAALLVQTYRHDCVGGQVIIQVGGIASITSLSNPSVDWINWQIQAASAGAAPNDWVEGPNQLTSFDPQVFAQYWSGFADLVSGSTYRPIVGGLITGPQPAVSLADGGTENAFCATLRVMKVKGYPWAWSYHGLSTTLQKDATVEASTTLGYRQIASDCAANGGPVSSTIFLSEAGRAVGPWQAADLDWLAWLDGQLLQDGVAGAALVVAAPASDNSLSLDPIVTPLAAYFANPTPGGTTSPDAGADAGTPDAGGGSGTITPHPPGGGDAVPPKSGGCASAPGLALLGLLVPVAALARRKRRQGEKR
jgi:hypothetical protein